MEVFRAGRRGAKLSPWDVYPDARKTFKDRLEGKGPFVFKMKDEELWSTKPVLLGTVMRKLDAAQPKMNQGDAFWAKTKTGSVYVLGCGELHLTASPAPPNISLSIVHAHDLVFTKTQALELELNRELRVVTMGYTVCKWISDTRVPSQHCPGPPPPEGGNAFDFAIQRKNSEGKWVVDIEATDLVVAHLEANGYSEVLWRGVANHYPNHAHCSGNPKRSGIPACL